MPEVNYLAVLAAVLAAFLLGGIWYSAMFAKHWAAMTGQSDETLKSGNRAVQLGGTLVMNLIAALVLAMFIGRGADIKSAALAGLAVGLCWVATSLGVIYLYERRPLSLWLLNGAYFTLQFTVMGAILGAMG